MIIPCDHQVTVRFLDNQLSESEVDRFESHLESCERCRQWLESAASDPETWKQTSDFLGSSTEIPCWSESVLKTQSGLNGSTLIDIPSHVSIEADLSILSPTDNPESLGRIGGYEIKGVIGRGGMGVVFKAIDQSLNRNVAIKVLDPSLAGVGAARSRFAREARAMAAISHDHVVPIYAVDEHRGLPYFAMEYVAGGTLEARLRHTGTLDVLSIVRIAHQIAQALAAAHDCGLVHRDIKPANILLDRGIERVRVTDFGLARVANDASHTRSGFVAGTPQFMSPEQVRGEACDARSDLFSLGCVMYAMCVGHSPFRAETLYGSMQRIVHDQPRSIREQNPDIPDWMEEFIDRLLEKDPSDRFATSHEAVELLSFEMAHLQSGSQASIPERTWMRKQRTVPASRRTVNTPHRWLVYGTATLSAVAILLIVLNSPFNSNQADQPEWSFAPRRNAPPSNHPQQENHNTNLLETNTTSIPAPPQNEQWDFYESDANPLTWSGRDELPQVRAQINLLQSRLLSIESAYQVDSWTSEANRIRNRILELMNE